MLDLISILNFQRGHEYISSCLSEGLNEFVFVSIDVSACRVDIRTDKSGFFFTLHMFRGFRARISRTSRICSDTHVYENRIRRYRFNNYYRSSIANTQPAKAREPYTFTLRALNERVASSRVTSLSPHNYITCMSVPPTPLLSR